jgi:hypothetical protein
MGELFANCVIHVLCSAKRAKLEKLVGSALSRNVNLNWSLEADVLEDSDGPWVQVPHFPTAAGACRVC